MRNLKILGLSLLALVGVLAVSASAAQAKWLLLENNVSVLLLNLVAEAEEGELLVPELGLAIHCEGGEGEVHVQLDGTHTTMTVEAEPEFFGCDDLNFGEVCNVNGPGDPSGTITASGSGTAGMNGTNVTLRAEAQSLADPFTDVAYTGEECPLVEIDGRVTGSVEFEVLESLVDSASHVVHLTEQDLNFGESAAELHNGEEGTLSGTLEGVNTFAAHLVGAL